MIRPVILCGGAGTRLWPLSRQSFPKPLLPLMGKESLLQQTVKRLCGDEFAAALVVCGDNHGLLIERQFDNSGSGPERILVEPAPRNTSAAAALAAAWIQSTGRDELILVMPSDHLIQNRTAFLNAISQGLPAAEAGAIVTFGAKPTEPNTQYGYIEGEPGALPTAGAHRIARFVEKPGADKAAEYLATGRFYWNTGIFLLKASTLLEEMQVFLSESLDAITSSVTNATTDGVFVRPEPQAFKRAVNISIDHGIMEKTSRGMVVPVEMEWSDVGSWDAVWKLGSKDPNNNATRGNVLAIDTHSCLIRSEEGGPLIATLGLDQMAVIATEDAVLVAPLARVAEVRNIVERLTGGAHESAKSPSRTSQPPETSKSLAEQPHFQLNHMIVDPGERWSGVSESQIDYPVHWIVISGTAEITIDDQISVVHQDASTFIPAGTRRSLANPREIPLEVVEIRIEGKPRAD